MRRVIIALLLMASRLSMEMSAIGSTNLNFGSGIFTVGDFFLVDGRTNIISFEVWATNKIYATAIEAN